MNEPAVPLADVEKLCREIAVELREIVEMLTTYHGIIGKAARVIALTAPHPAIERHEAVELARELARMAHIEADIERLLLRK